MTLSLDLLLKERDLGTPPADRKTRGEAPGTVEVVIESVGTLRNTVIDEAR